MTANDEDRRRLERLARDLEELRRRREPRSGRREPPHAAASHLVMRLLTDLAAGLIAGVLLGWGIDRWLETKPWGVVVGSLLGLAAGVRNVLRTADSVSRKPPPGTKPDA